MAAVAVLLCATVGALISSTPTSALFLQVPDPLNVTVGAVAEFFCRANGDSVFWTVNGASVNQLDDPNIDPDDGPVVDGVRTEILRITADVQYNNSVIQCRSFTSGEGETASAPALLMVQGLLSAPTNMNASQPNSSAIMHLYWDPPFSLNITHMEPDISGYTVSITNNNTNETSERNVTKPEFLFQEEGYDPCHVYLFEVSARNPVGVGEKSDEMNKCFGAAPQSANVSWTMRNSSEETQTILHLMITYDMSCHGRRPDKITVTIIMTDRIRMQVNPSPLSQTGKLDKNLTFSVDNPPCGIEVTVINQFGSNRTEIMIEEDCQLRGTEDDTEESSPGNNPAIPVIASAVCGAVLVITIIVILSVIFVKCRGEREVDIDIEDFMAKDNQYTDVPTNAERQTSSRNTERQMSSEWQNNHSPSASSTDSQYPLLPIRIEADSQTPFVPGYEPTVSQPPHVPSHEPTASQTPNVPSHEPTDSQPPIVPRCKPTASQPSREATASQPPNVPSREPTASQPPNVPSREPTSSQPPNVPSRKPTASQPPNVPSRKPTASQPPNVPSRKPTASQPPNVPSQGPTASQKNSELQYAELAIPQQQQPAPRVPQGVAYALVQPQDTKVSTDHEN